MKKQMTPKIYIFVALECEAKPLINYFGLKKQSNLYTFPLYTDEQILLTVTGVGKVAMAGAVTYTFALFPTTDIPLIINMGIAGHKSIELGCLLLAVKIVDQETGRKFYPLLVGDNSSQVCEVTTTSLPCRNYKESSVFDMEASAFYEMAIRFGSIELIHSIKIISDNEFSSIAKISSDVVFEWVTSQLDEIDCLIKQWALIRERMNTPKIDDFLEIRNRLNFTVNGQLKLNALLLRWKVLANKSWLKGNNDLHFSNGKELLKKLEKDISNLEIHL